jgi:hypothetical protein
MTNEQGKCANCGSQNINYIVYHVEENEIEHIYECRDCGAEGHEYYDLVFRENLEATEENGFEV